MRLRLTLGGAAMLATAACAAGRRDWASELDIDGRAVCARWRDSLPPGGLRVYLESEVEAPVASQQLGRLPPSLGGIEGEVVVRFVVAEDGTADMSTYTVLHASYHEFVPYVRELTVGTRYDPARIRGVPVRQCVVQPYSFRSG